MSETYVQYRNKLMSKLDQAVKALTKKVVSLRYKKTTKSFKERPSKKRVEMAMNLRALNRTFWREWMKMPENRSWPGREASGVGRFRRGWIAATVVARFIKRVSPAILLQEYNYLQEAFAEAIKLNGGRVSDDVLAAKETLDRYHLGK